MVMTLLCVRDKSEFNRLSEEIWPPRTKTDLALRRSRLLDFVKFFRSRGQLSRVRTVMCVSREGWDIIWLTNLVAATAVLGDEWFERWHWLGAFDYDLSHFLRITKKVHDLGKSVGLGPKLDMVCGVLHTGWLP